MASITSTMSLADEKAQISHIDVESEIDSLKNSENLGISEVHKQYLIAKHGRYDLTPLPTMDDEDPLNWPNWVKNFQLGIVVCHGFFTTFFASGTVPAFGPLSVELNQPIDRVSYVTSCQIIILGLCPSIWTPFMNKYGKRQILIITSFIATMFNLGCVFAKSYGALIALRCMVAFFFSTGTAIGGSVVSETTFSHQRGSRSGIWGLMVNLGTIAGPLFMGFVAQRQAPKYIFVVFTGISFVQVLLYIFFAKETTYNYDDKSRNEPNRFKQLIRFRTIMPERKANIAKILSPAKLFASWKVAVAGIAYGICFMFDNIATNVELPIVMGEKFHMGPQATGLQFLSFLIGSLIGEQFGGWMSDKWMIFGKSRNKGKAFRLWMSYPGFITSVVGLAVYGVQIQKAESWNITPLVGLVICSVGLQIVTTTMIAFSMDTEPTRHSEVALFLTAVRQTLGFIGPFFYPKMYSSLGFANAYGIMAGLIAALAMIPTIIVHFYDDKNRHL
ncbi:major facilitator superfamily domain-containing protein [Scheffersomyces xylosifermentans]|uniref:major facilitator superfamily domain-containing protein n=1 Tax=Scheffersomyces xylosifermentans TaxID=1304137 RepID=UPI00315DC3FA